MTYSFTEIFPDKINIQPVLMSGIESLHLNRKDYLITEQIAGEKLVYEIRYSAHCSPFKEAIVTENILAVGHEEHFYLFDLISNTSLLRLKMVSYFGHFYVTNNFFIVASAGGLYSISNRGKINWQNLNLGIDGLIITAITDDKIYGSGDWDPPDGWKDFVLDKKTGLHTE